MSARKYAETLLEASRRMSADSAYRSRIESDFEASSALLREAGADVPASVSEIRFLRNSGGTFNVVLGPDPNVSLGHESLGGVVSGGSSSMDELIKNEGQSTFSTLPLTLSTLSSVKK